MLTLSFPCYFLTLSIHDLNAQALDLIPLWFRNLTGFFSLSHLLKFIYKQNAAEFNTELM